MTKRNVKTNGFSPPTSRKLPPNTKAQCPKCGREVQLLRCGHCGSRLPAEQADWYGAVITKLATLSDRADAGKKQDATNVPIRRKEFGKRHIGNTAGNGNHAETENRKPIDKNTNSLPQPDLRLEEYQALLAFVQAIGGWTRAKWVLEEGHKKCQENQNG
jgi:hypothetical protein